MAQPKNVLASALYSKMAETGFAMGDTNFCTVTAVSAATGVAFDTVHALFAAEGRAHRKGVSFFVQERVLARLGYKMVRQPIAELVAAYPKKAREYFTTHGVTTHHPARFNKHWPAGTFFLYSRGHVSCVVDGVLHDWAVGRALRCGHNVYRIERA
jgi:hypothetical protein